EALDVLVQAEGGRSVPRLVDARTLEHRRAVVEDVGEGVDLRVGEIHQPPVHPDLLDIFVRHSNLRLRGDFQRVATVFPSVEALSIAAAASESGAGEDDGGDRGRFRSELSGRKGRRGPAAGSGGRELLARPAALGADEDADGSRRKLR